MNDLRTLLGIELPIVQAPMAGVQGSPLAIAVRDAGGLGSLPCAMLSVETMRSELQALSAQTTKTYNLNFFCHTPPIPDPRREALWRKMLAPYYEEFAIDPQSIATTAGRKPFDRETADLLSEFRPPILSFHFGLPSADLLAQVRSWGAKILSSATTLEEAQWLEARGVDAIIAQGLEARGVDAIIAQGLEAGGHRGHFLSDDVTKQFSTLSLVRRLVKTVKTPIIAAGGIADHQDVIAAFEAGAVAVQAGTAYLLSTEATTSAIHRKALESDAAYHTALTNLFSGGRARGIVNRLMKELGHLSGDVPAFPLASSAIAPLRAKAESLGSGDFSPLWSGAYGSKCKELPAAQITRELAGC